MNLIITKPYIQNVEGEDKTRLVSNIKIEGKKDYKMWLEVENEYAEYLTPEVADCFVVGLMLYAMDHNLNIKSEAPITERLHYQLTEYMIPALNRNIPSYKRITIDAPLANISFGGKYAATGISCGVDSFYTILKNQNHSEESGLNVKYLTYFNAGASGMYGGKRARRIFNERAIKFREVATELGCGFVTVDTNMNEFLHQNHEATHVFRTLCIPMALQKLFKVYYFSSTFEYNLFKFEKFDPSYYDILTMPNLSTDNIRFVLVGGETTRQKKVEFIADNEIVKRNLNVCVLTTNNCGMCIKCMRTILNLYVAGKLDEFGDCFNVARFYRNRRKYIQWALLNQHKVDMPELVDNLKKKGLVKKSDYYLPFIK